MATSLADYSSASLMIPELRGLRSYEVIQELCLALQRENRIPDLLPFYHAILNHEFLVSSDTEAGMAIPHAPLAGLREPVFATGRSNEPIYWGAKAMRTVRLVFLIAMPDTDSTQYLLLISSLARLSRDEALMQRLQTVPTAEQMFEILQQVKVGTQRATQRSEKGGER